jgi:hypothetical protein
MLVREPADSSLGEEGEDTAHEARAGERGRGDGTQDLLHKEQQVGHVDINVLPLTQLGWVYLT